MFMLQFLCKTEKAAVDQHSSPVSVCPPKSLALPTWRESRALDGVYVWQTCRGRGAAEATKPISTRSSTCLLIIPVCLYHSCCDQSEVIVINRNVLILKQTTYCFHVRCLKLENQSQSKRTWLCDCHSLVHLLVNVSQMVHFKILNFVYLFSYLTVKVLDNQSWCLITTWSLWLPPQGKDKS